MRHGASFIRRSLTTGATVTAVGFGTLGVGSATSAQGPGVTLIPLDQERCISRTYMHCDENWDCSCGSNSACAVGFERFDESDYGCGWSDQTSEILETGITGDFESSFEDYYSPQGSCSSSGYNHFMVEFELPAACLLDIAAEYQVDGGDRYVWAQYALELRVRPECPDIDGDGMVGFSELLAVLAAWGPYMSCPPFRVEDLDQDCDVDLQDLLVVLASWGPCETGSAPPVALPESAASHTFSCRSCVRLWGPGGELLFGLDGFYGYVEDSVTLEAAPGVYVLEAVGIGSSGASGAVTVEEYVGPQKPQVISSVPDPEVPLRWVYTVDGQGLDLTPFDDLYDGSPGSMASLTLDVPYDVTIWDVNVTLDIAHTWAGDLVVKLASPAGTVVDLVSRPGLIEPADDGTDCCGESSDLVFGNSYEIDDAASLSSERMGSGGEDPIHPFVLFSSGFANIRGLTTLRCESSAGTWTLYVGDAAAGDTGTLDGFTIEIW